MDAILVINAGSSSLKFQLFQAERSDDLNCLLKGQMDGIGANPRLRAKSKAGEVLIDKTYASDEVMDLPAAIHEAGGWLQETQNVNFIAIGHRVVHGGPDFDRPVLVDRDILSRLEKYICLAPLHQPHNLAPIRSLLERRPELPQIACFDTSFHRGHSAVVDHYALPERFYAQGLRRYGFHGLSYEYVAGRLSELAPQIANGRAIIAHLGNGASMCALSGGRSIESTMGFTALDGLPMGTRPGQIDPGAILHLILEEGMTAAALQDMLYHECGLKGLSGISNDMRELEASHDPQAKFALQYFAYRIGLFAGLLAAALGGLDAFVFTAGIGENSSLMRARIGEKLSWLGASIDPVTNEAGATIISKPDSRVALFVIPTNEELMIARHMMSLLATKSAYASRTERIA